MAPFTGPTGPAPTASGGNTKQNMQYAAEQNLKQARYYLELLEECCGGGYEVALADLRTAIQSLSRVQ